MRGQRSLPPPPNTHNNKTSLHRNDMHSCCCLPSVQRGVGTGRVRSSGPSMSHPVVSRIPPTKANTSRTHRTATAAGECQSNVARHFE